MMSGRFTAYRLGRLVAVLGGLLAMGCLSDSAPAIADDLLAPMAGADALSSEGEFSGSAGEVAADGPDTPVAPDENTADRGGVDEPVEPIDAAGGDASGSVGGTETPAPGGTEGEPGGAQDPSSPEPVGGQPPPPEPPIRYLGLETNLEHSDVLAGEAVEVFCRPVVVDDRESPPLDYVIEVRPDTAVEIDGTTVTAVRPGRYLVTCTAPDLNLRDLTPAALSVEVGPLARIDTPELPDQVVAGEEVLVGCEGSDAFGNARMVETPHIQVVPTTAGDSLVVTGDVLVLEASGTYLVRCASAHPDEAGAIRSGVVELDVVAGPIASLMACAEESLPDAVRPGIPVEPCLEAYDQFGNVTGQTSVSWAVSPEDDGVERLGPGSFLPHEDGSYTLEASAEIEGEAPVTVSFSLVVDGTPPVISCGYGLEDRGHPIDDDLTISGRVEENIELRRFEIGGVPYDLNDFGRFSVSYDTDYGINALELEAEDLAANQSRNQCIFMGVTKNWDPDHPLREAINFELRQQALDDGVRDGRIDSLGDLFAQVVGSDLVTDLIDTGLATQEFPDLIGVHPVYRSETGVSLPNSPDMSLTYLVSERDCTGDSCSRWARWTCENDAECEVPYTCQTNDDDPDDKRCLPRPALRMRLAIQNLHIPISSDCGSSELTGDLVLSEAVIVADFAFDAQDSRLDAAPSGPLEVEFGSISLSNVVRHGGFRCRYDENIIRGAVNLDSIFGFIRGPLESTTRELLDSELSSILSSVLGGIDFAGLLGRSAVFAPSGDRLVIDFGSNLHDAKAEAEALVLEIKSDVRVTSDRFGADDADEFLEFEDFGIPPSVAGLDAGGGVPLLERPGQPSAAGLQPDDGISIVVDFKLFNRILYGLWKLNFFVIDSESGLLGDALDVDLSLPTPPVVEGLVSDRKARLFLVPMVGELSYPGIIDEPFPFKMGTAILFDITLENGELSFGGNIEIEDFVLVIENADLDEAQSTAIENDLRGLLEEVISEVLGGALPTITIPAIELPDSLVEYGIPPGQSLAVDRPNLAVGHTRIYLEGNLSQ